MHVLRLNRKFIYVPILASTFAMVNPGASQEPTHMYSGDLYVCETQKGRKQFKPFSDRDARASDKCKIMREPAYDFEVVLWRTKTMQRGDMSDKGLIVEIAQPIAKVQTSNAERWYRVEDLLPSEIQR